MQQLIKNIVPCWYILFIANGGNLLFFDKFVSDNYSSFIIHNSIVIMKESESPLMEELVRFPNIQNKRIFFTAQICTTNHLFLRKRQFLPLISTSQIIFNRLPGVLSLFLSLFSKVGSNVLACTFKG